MTGWFSVDKDGLRKLIDDRGKVFALYELIQNAWDTDADHIEIVLTKIPGRPFAHLKITDNDPNGFHDLSHAYTLFAESAKKSDPTKRGRFNLGEKFVLALCRSASVMSTTGGVCFHEDGTMTRSRANKTEVGSVFQAEIRMNQAEYDEVCSQIYRLIPPPGKTTIFNDEEILAFSDGSVVAQFEATLPTLIANDDGILRRTQRKTTVRVYEGNGPGWIYEMGIPVVETGDTFHVDIGQKVPLTIDRDNVPPAYLRKVRAEVLNHTASVLPKSAASEAWVSNALEADEVSDEAVHRVLDERFGEKRASFDPSDREANMNVTAQGYTVVAGGTLSKAAWANVRRAGAIKPAGQISPTPKPFSDNPNAPPFDEIPRSEWTKGMRQVAQIVLWFARELGIHGVSVIYGKAKAQWWAAAWGDGVFSWNVSNRGVEWFDDWRFHLPRVLDIMIHEFAHSRALNHLEESYHKACTDIGARVAVLCLQRGQEIPHLSSESKHRDDHGRTTEDTPELGCNCRERAQRNWEYRRSMGIAIDEPSPPRDFHFSGCGRTTEGT